MASLCVLLPTAVDFDFTTAAGLSKPDALPPTLQVAFQYTVLVATKPESAVPAAPVVVGASGNGTVAAASVLENGGSTAVVKTAARPLQRFTLQRRLRVATYRVRQEVKDGLCEACEAKLSCSWSSRKGMITLAKLRNAKSLGVCSGEQPFGRDQPISNTTANSNSTQS